MPASKSKAPKGQRKYRQRKLSTPKEEQAQEPVNGVLVQLVPGDNPGDKQIVVQALGEVKGTESPSLLKLAAKVAEQQLGID